VQLRNEHKLEAEQVESITLGVHPLVLELTGKKTPQTGLESKFSVYHSAAVGVIYGAAGEEQYSDHVVRDGRVIALRDKVTAAVEKGVHEDQARIAIRLKSGKSVEKFVEHAIGSLDRPMSDADLEAKFHGLADGILTRPGADRLMRLCWDIGKLKDAGEVARASVPAAAPVKAAAR
jgi:2-methylcitrate dehydratase PrpD